MTKANRERRAKLLEALKELDGTATTQEIAKKSGINTNGASQTLAVMSAVKVVNVKKHVTTWELVQDLCDGCYRMAVEEHKCAGEIGSEMSSSFPSRQCACPYC